jgi:hypothetical protein
MIRLALTFLACATASARASAADQEEMALATAGEWGGAQGVYTCDQWRQYLQRMYNDADKRRRGYFDAQDFEAVRRISPVFRAATFDYFDMSGKGRVTKAEFLAFPSPFFERYDKRRSCRVTQDEIARARAQGPAASGSPRQPAGGSGFPGAGRSGGFGGAYGGGFGGGGFGR